MTLGRLFTGGALVFVVSVRSNVGDIKQGESDCAFSAEVFRPRPKLGGKERSLPAKSALHVVKYVPGIHSPHSPKLENELSEFAEEYDELVS